MVDLKSEVQANIWHHIRVIAFAILAFYPSSLPLMTTPFNNLNFSLRQSVRRIRSFSGPYLPAFRLNTGKYGPEKLRIRILFAKCSTCRIFFECQSISYNIKFFPSAFHCTHFALNDYWKVWNSFLNINTGSS